ncbi:hypothetical protein QL285_036976 [Trifolium repens]|nr:hypothetical protein QL285_036976 [Trifolium repens]
MHEKAPWKSRNVYNRDYQKSKIGNNNELSKLTLKLLSLSNRSPSLSNFSRSFPKTFNQSFLKSHSQIVRSRSSLFVIPMQSKSFTTEICSKLHVVKIQ